MRFSYNKLWKLLIDRGINKKTLCEMSGVSATSIAKLGKGENITTDVLLRICVSLECDVSDIMEIVKEEEQRRILSMAQQEVVKKFRNQVIEGKCIDIVPVNEELLPDIMRLRNQERSRYYLNQTVVLTLDMQKNWYTNYCKRFDDIYWCIRNKEGIIIGTVRLYNINEETCEHGSLIIDENYSMGLPYALETEILTLEFAFNELGVKKIVNDDRSDNAMMNSITRKMGFKFEKEIEIGGVPYNHYILQKKDSKVEKYKKSLDSFMNR